MKTIHWIIIIIAGLGITALVIWLLTKKPKVGEIMTHPISGKKVKVIEVDPITKEPTVIQEPGKEPIRLPHKK